MRTVLVGIALAMATACSGDVSFEHESVLNSPTRGIVLEDDQSAQAGMVGNTCEVDVNSSNIGEDVDVAMDEDVVVDGAPGRILVRGADGLHLYEPGNFDWYWGSGGPDVSGGDIETGRLTETATVAMHADCTVSWHGDLTGATRFSDDCTSATGFVVDKSSGQAYIAHDGVVTSASTEGSEDMASGDLIAWDAAAEVLYVADLDGAEVRAVEPTGGLRWATPVDGAVRSLEAMGQLGTVAVMIETDLGGQLLVIDGLTGEITSSLNTPSAAAEMDASESGRTLAVILPGQTHFFRVRGF